MTSALSTSDSAVGARTTRASGNRLCELRNRFLADPAGTDLSILRPVIARAWKRSQRSWVDPNLSPLRAARTPQLEDRVIGTAEAPIRKLLESMSDDRTCVGLADSHGTLAALRGSHDALLWAAQKFAVGRSMSEDIIGTNCVGTALEDGDGLRVRGAEHFTTRLHDTMCASSPVRDPLRGSVRAVLMIALPVASCLDDLREVTALLDDAAREIASVLAVRAAPREHALLMAYLRELRKRGAGAVVAIDGRTTLASRDALEILAAQDFAVLSAYAQQSVRAHQRIVQDIVLTNNRTASVCVEPVLAGRERVGSVLQVRVAEARPARARPAHTPEGDAFEVFVGESGALRRGLDLAHVTASRGLPAHIVGEPGTGKRTLATAIAATRSDETLRLDLHGASHIRRDELQRMSEALDRGAALVLTRADCLRELGWRALADVFEGRPSNRVFITACRLPDFALRVLATIGSVEIIMPALDARREDIPSLVAHCLAATADGPRRVSPRLMRLFTEATLTRNVAQLREIVQRATVRCAGNELTSDDLADEDRRALMRMALSPLQTAEAEQIREALRRAEGSRVRAAAILKIGRSTLYRRLDAYARLGFDLEEEMPGVAPGAARAGYVTTGSFERAVA
jgi:transcriptional regulator of acetoin/glycerol metabolism